MSIERYGKDVKLGYAFGERIMRHMPMAASQAFVWKSGCFVKRDASGHGEIADSGDAYLVGWCETGQYTTSSTAGQDLLPVDRSYNSCYWIPADATVDITLVGKSCDLIVSGGIQYADIGESTEDVIIIEGVDVTNQLVLVRMNPGATREGVA